MYDRQTHGYEKIARRKWAGWRAWIWIQRILHSDKIRRWLLLPPPLSAIFPPPRRYHYHYYYYYDGNNRLGIENE